MMRLRCSAPSISKRRSSNPDTQGVRYLYLDTNERLEDGGWWLFAVLGAVGVLVWAIGIPVGFFLVARASKKGNTRLGRSRAALLTQSYVDHAWWVEVCGCGFQAILSGPSVMPVAGRYCDIQRIQT